MKKITVPTVKLLWSTPDPRRVVGIAGRMTYSAMDVNKLTENLGEEEIAKTVKAILERRHYSVLRHVSFMFSVSGVSRAFSHQLVRHAVGHAYEQRSQHYRTERNFSSVIPKVINEDEHIAGPYMEFMEQAQEMYDFLMSEGVTKDDARFVLPNAVETQLVWTANLEGLVNFIKARSCRVNTPEIMAVAIATRKIVVDLFPEMKNFLGPTCFTQGMCFEGPKFYSICNKPWKSPTVLWTPEFPLVIELVGIGGRITQMSTAKRVDKHEPFEVVNYP